MKRRAALGRLIGKSIAQALPSGEKARVDTGLRSVGLNFRNPKAIETHIVGHPPKLAPSVGVHRQRRGSGGFALLHPETTHWQSEKISVNGVQNRKASLTA